MMRRCRLFLFCAVVWLAVAPAGRAQSGGGSSASTSKSETYKFTKIDFELLEKVRQLDRYFEDKGFLYKDPEVNEYVARVAASVVPKDTPENVVWKFRVIRDPMPNAFAMPNGSIYVHTGLLALLENEAQLASVLAHEVRHVLGLHSYLTNRSLRKKMVAIHILSAASAAAGAAGGWGSVASAVINIIPAMVVATVYGYSRELERESDVKAFTALNEAGYSTEEMPNTFRLLKTSHEVELDSEPIFYRSHPKLDERISYITDMVNAIRPKVPHPMVEAERYAASVEKGVRHNIYLDIQSGRARTAVAVARRQVKLNRESAEALLTLADAYRALGPRTPEPTPEELADKGKKEARKMLGKMTLEEYEKALMDKPEGKGAWEENRKLAEETYRKALELDPENARIYRGLGMLYERANQPAEAVEAFRRYLELAPTSTDRVQITRRMEALEKQLQAATTPPPTP